MTEFQYQIKESITPKLWFLQRFWNWYFTFTNYIKTKHLSLKDTNISRGHRDETPLLCAFPPWPPAPSSDTEVCRREPEIAHNHVLLCLSAVRPICAVIISVFEALMAALPGKIMGPIIFNELHQRFQWACYHLNKDTLVSNTAFLSSKWLWVCVKLKNTLFPFQPCWIWKGQERQFRKKQAWLLAECPLPWPDVHMCCFHFTESISSAKWNLLYHDFLFIARNMFPWKISSNKIRNKNKTKAKNNLPTWKSFRGWLSLRRIKRSWLSFEISFPSCSWLFFPKLETFSFVFTSTATRAQSQSSFCLHIYRTLVVTLYEAIITRLLV